jgi:purine-cytosine permease-like protein
VVVAGWNTASPTLYRAGLALQVATPNWKRWMVTMVVGAGMIICACIPSILTHMDLLLTTNALLLLPLGAFILIDVWVLPRLGLEPYFAERTKAAVGWPAAAAWILPVIISFIAFAWYGANPIFLAGPDWVVAIGLYLLFTFIQQKSAA